MRASLRIILLIFSWPRILWFSIVPYAPFVPECSSPAFLSFLCPLFQHVSYSMSIIIERSPLCTYTLHWWSHELPLLNGYTPYYYTHPQHTLYVRGTLLTSLYPHSRLHAITFSISGLLLNSVFSHENVELDNLVRSVGLLCRNNQPSCDWDWPVTAQVQTRFGALIPRSTEKMDLSVQTHLLS